MKVDAVRVYVRGFGSQEVGERIVAYLEEEGFRVAEFFNGNEDSLGGIIGTHINECHNTASRLEHVQDYMDYLLKDVKAIAPEVKGIFLQWEGFDKVASSDDARPQRRRR